MCALSHQPLRDTMPLLRTFLFAPGNRPRMLQKVGQCGADAVILDLEDAVPIADKEATRPVVRAAAQAITTCAVYIRINPLVAATSFSQAIGEADLQAIVCPALSGIILPKQRFFAASFFDSQCGCATEGRGAIGSGSRARSRRAMGYEGQHVRRVASREGARSVCEGAPRWERCSR